MKVVKFALFPTSLGEDVNGCDAGLAVWDPIVEIGGVAASRP